MKKIGLSITVALFVIALSGCAKNNQEAGGEMLEERKEPGSQSGDLPISNIYDAMMSGGKMKCSYTIEEEAGQVLEAVVFVDGQKYKSTTEFDGKQMHTFFDGETVYSWNDFSSQGTKIREGCFDEIEVPQDEEMPEQQVVQDPKEMFDDAFNVKCEKVSEPDLSLPEDIEFSDQCEFLKNQMRQMEQLQQGLPEGFELPEGVEMPEGFEMP